MKKIVFNNLKINELVTHNEDALLNLFTKKAILSKNIEGFNDCLLKEMYDHNFYRAYREMDEDDINLCYLDNQQKKRNYIKIESVVRQPFLEKNKEYEIEVDSALIILNKIDIPVNKDIVLKHLSKEDISADLIDLELRNYQKEYGRDFCIQKMKRYISKVSEGGLDFVGAYLNDRCVASCHIYNDQQSISLDGLTVEEKYRHQKIASTLLQHVINTYNLPVFLHADENDAPINMYKKIGFKTVNSKFYYFKKLTN